MDRIWSKVKKAFEQQLAVELKTRLQVHVAAYPRGGRDWMVFEFRHDACRARDFT